MLTLRHLVRVAQKPAVTIRIIPLNQGPHVGLHGPFALLGFAVPLDDVLYLESGRRGELLIAETKTRDFYDGPGMPKVENPTEVIARYEDDFEHLLRLALEPAESLELIEGVAAKLAA